MLKVINRGGCKHWTGMARTLYARSECLAGVRYGDARHGTALLPCLPGNDHSSCTSFEMVTDEEAEQAKRDRAVQIERYLQCRKADVSPCCEAPIDRSQVIKTGRYKGHGPHLCSKCKKMVYWV